MIDKKILLSSAKICCILFDLKGPKKGCGNRRTHAANTGC